MAVLPQLPLQTPIADSKSGRITSPWGFYFSALVNNLPGPNSRVVIDGSGTTANPTTIYQGLDSAKPTANINDIYFSTDHGTIYIVNALGNWQLVGETSPTAVTLIGGATGQLVFQIAENHTSFIPIGQQGEILTVTSGIPTWQPATSLSAHQGYATGGGSDPNKNDIFFLNSRTVTTSFTIPVGYNASSVGPITINSTSTVTLPIDSTWLIQ